MKIKYILPTLLLLLSFGCNSQSIPSIYQGFSREGDSINYNHSNLGGFENLNTGLPFELSQMVNAVEAHHNGFSFDFNDSLLNGHIYYGFINYEETAFAFPVWFKRVARIEKGKAEIDMNLLKGKYDMVNWEERKSGLLAYRIQAEDGMLLYEGRIRFKYNHGFEILPTIIEGPTLHKIDENSATVRVVLNKPRALEFWINRSIVKSDSARVHEIEITGLDPATTYKYEIQGMNMGLFSLTTAPAKGSSIPFVFSYASDSRNGQGGGERNLYGANAYIMNRIMAMNKKEGVAFMQFSGDLIDGYLTRKDEMNLQYANWKRSLEPFSHYFPVYVAMGNHEALGFAFRKDTHLVMVDKFPFDTESAERIFQDNFCNPVSELISEDGASYDPNPDKIDFPSYEETVYDYQYGNVAVVVLNSNYWYAPFAHIIPETGGNIHAYIMDNQLKWLKGKIQNLETDKSVEHVFVTLHTPFFPNGGHVEDDMWYGGNNEPRPTIAGKPVDKGIIERRDQLLEIIVNQSTKVRAILTGDEHNYAKTQIGPATAKYPLKWSLDKLELKRSIWQINNGSAGAPYYAQEKTPWSNMVSGFSTQNVNVLFYVNGKSIEMKVVNPLTHEVVDKLKLH
jgi:hypothetical protein